ncbi:MAG: class I SAM-dependent methyltransferase [Candidatus Marsarchaeota archaeon]|nr:class I SAM-dependent methyltransferase [Candidatus Marsarchaeota archaeon]
MFMHASKEELSNFYESKLGKAFLKSEVALLLHEIHKGEKILHVGSGLGLVEKYMTGIAITGIENSEDLLSVARRGSNALFVKGKAENLPFLKETFDIVIFSPFPDSINDYETAMKEAVAVLKPQGRVMLMTMNKNSVYYASLRKENPNYADMMRFVDLKYVESAMPRTMKLTGLKRVNLLGSASSESDPDMYLLTYSKA